MFLYGSKDYTKCHHSERELVSSRREAPLVDLFDEDFIVFHVKFSEGVSLD